MSGPTANPNAWRPSDLEAIRRALLIPVTAPALRAINDAMAQLERSYPEAILAAKASVDAIAVIDAGQLGWNCRLLRHHIFHNKNHPSKNGR